MKKTIFLLLVAILPFSCKKDTVDISQIKGTMDLKNLSLSALKSFLNGKWRLHRSELGTIAGTRIQIIPDSIRVYLIFYPVDTIRWENTLNNIVLREKLEYERLRLPVGGDPQYVNVLLFGRGQYDYSNRWVADRLDNDTLVFVNYFKSEGGDSFYYTKEQ